MALTKVTYSMIAGSQANILDFGAVADGVTNNATALKSALESGAQYVYIPPGTYAFTSNVSATIPTNVTLYGHATFKYTGATNNQNYLIRIEVNNNTLTVDGLSFDGDNKVAACLGVYNSATPSSNTLPNCTISNNLFIRFRMNVIGIYNEAANVSGSFQLVTIANNRIRLITRAAGTGSPGSTGTTGIAVSQLSSSQYVRECLHYGNQYAAIFGDDLVTSPNCVDYDGFKFFGPDPSTNFGQYVDATLTSYGNVFRNCAGRAIKVQAVGSVRDETIIRDDGSTIFGGSTEINFQYGVGMISNCQFFYRSYDFGKSPIQTGLSLVSFYHSADYNEDSASSMVNGLQVFNSINPSVTTGTHVIDQVVTALVASAGIGDPIKPLISINNISITKNPIKWIVTIGFAAGSYGTVRLDNVVVPSLVYSAVGTNGADTNYDIVATNVMNIDGVATPANAKPFVTTTTGTGVSYGGVLLGGLNQGFLSVYSVGTGSFNKAPMLVGGGLSDPLGRAGGATSVQSIELADDATYEFDARFFTQSRGLFIVSVNFDYTTQGVFVTGGNAIYKIAVPVGDLFQVSTTGTNPDIDLFFNMWYTGGKLNVKNRLGASYTATITFIG